MFTPRSGSRSPLSLQCHHKCHNDQVMRHISVPCGLPQLITNTTTSPQIFSGPQHHNIPTNLLWSISFTVTIYIWVRSWNCGCLVTWFCYQLIAKPGNKTATVSWPDPYTVLKIRTICHAQDLWKLAPACKQLHLLCLPDPTKFTRYYLTRWISKLPGKLWNPLSKIVLTNCSFIWNKWPVNIWNDLKAQK